MHQSRLLRFILSRLDPRAAPIVTRLSQLNRWPSLRVTISIGITIACLSVMVWTYLLIFHKYIPQNSALRLIVVWLGMISSMTLIALPGGVASGTARLTGKDVRSQEFALLRITTLTAHALIHGYFGAMVLRRRLFFSIMAGLLPNVVGFTIVLYSESRWQPVVLLKIVVVLMAIMAILQLCIIGGLVAAVLALALRSETLVSLLAGFSSFIIIIVMIGALLYVILTESYVGAAITGAAMFLVPYGMLQLLLRAKWVWVDRILTKYPSLSVEV